MGVSLITVRGEARADQAAIYKQLHGRLFPACPVQAIQRRLKRWSHILGPSKLRVCAECSASNMSTLRRQVPPCVLSACIHTLFNGWTTARRFQKEAPCVCCKTSGSDSIEHY
eukprot:7294556-Pyramimonas_sp.AAC.1